MRIGYPCINTTLGCRSNRTFRLKSYSRKRLTETIRSNLECLAQILWFNAEHNISFFRITSDLIPFASHRVCDLNWQRHFRNQFQEIGQFMKKRGIRSCMHAGQYTILNSMKSSVVDSSVRELRYHAQLLDLMELDSSAKIQIHVGGVYQNKAKSVKRFIERVEMLEEQIKRRLVIENDERNYTFGDCLRIATKTRVPMLLDIFHHTINCSGEPLQEALTLITETWTKQDGLPMVDYSSQKAGCRKGKHAETIDVTHFKEFLDVSKPHDFDVMLEIKDKEKSAFKAIEIASKDRRFKGVSWKYLLKSDKRLD